MDIKNLLDRCRQGDPGAEQELVCYYVSRVSGFAEKRIASLYKRRFDGDDVANSVMKSLILRVRKGMIDCEDEWKLWSLLLLMTKRKVNRRVREAQQAKRDIRREMQPAVSDDVSGIELAEIVENSDNESYDESAYLLEKAILHIENHQVKQSSPTHREVLELTMKGLPYAEICETLKKRVGKDISLKLIQRKMRDIREAVLEVVESESELGEG
jgi:DNA-directed RNA polymerase specialized sigma24 family protein